MRRQLLAQLHSQRRPKHTWTTDQIRSTAQQLQTDSSPTQTALPGPIESLRQQVQSNPHIHQLTSGQRTCNYTLLQLPRHLRLRTKPKLHPTTSRPLLSIDELEAHSRDSSKATYLPISAGHLHTALSDPAFYRQVNGMVRPDIVQHAGKVLQLRVLSELQRCHTQFAAHATNPPVPLAIPEKGTTQGLKVTRLDVIRMEVNGRVVRQDAQWGGVNPFISNVPEGSLIADVLPPGGLQCIIRLPLPSGVLSDTDGVQALSVLSEKSAQAVWTALRRMLGGTDKEAVGFNVLEQQGEWVAAQITGRPEPHCQPMLSLQALQFLYHCLPELVPGLRVEGPTRQKRGKNKNKQDGQDITEEPDHHGKCRPIVAETEITYRFSLTEPGFAYANVDGTRTKTVPVYDAEAMFGKEIASTVLPWLLATQAPDRRLQQGSPSHCNVGVVALPCTVDLAAQLHRLVVYSSGSR